MCVWKERGVTSHLSLPFNNYRVKPASTHEPSQIAIHHLGEGHLPRVLHVLIHLPLKVLLACFIVSVLRKH
mgnify:CR=1 FL=1